MKKNGTVQIEGVKFDWRIYRQPKWTSEGLVGMAILITTMEAGTRELLLEFAMDGIGHRCMATHQRFRISDKRLIQCIKNALKAGWNPNERGKKFVFQSPSLQKAN